MSPIGLKRINEYLVHTQVGCRCITILGIQIDAMSMRAFLPLRVDAGSKMLNDISGVSKASILQDG